jgi:O-succinylbenzoate synthase
MRLAFSPYELRSRTALGKSAGSTRSGALLRFELAEGIGYADCHPWPELGDESLEQQLALLSSGEFTRLTRRSLALARIDALARASQRSVFENSIPPSHILSGNVLDVSARDLERFKRDGFSTVKTKAGHQPHEEAQHLRALAREAVAVGMKIRIDLNESLTLASALMFSDVLCGNGGGAGIDFVEDPMAYRAEDWRELKERFPLRLALDRGAVDFAGDLQGDESFDVMVLKPAIQDPAAVLGALENAKKTLVVTSYLDHPIGTLGAAWAAAEAQAKLGTQLELCGLMTHLNYEQTGFPLQREGSRLIAPEGTGFGFDEELQRMQWAGLL